jgi:hypothetical protein
MTCMTFAIHTLTGLYLGPVQTLTKVPRPFGTAGRHFNLQREMGLESDRGLYNQIQVSVLPLDLLRARLIGGA